MKWIAMLNEGSDLSDAVASILCNKENRVFNTRSVSANWNKSANTDQYAATLSCRQYLIKTFFFNADPLGSRTFLFWFCRSKALYP